jgi:hypothetical protein
MSFVGRRHRAWAAATAGVLLWVAGCGAPGGPGTTETAQAQNVSTVVVRAPVRPAQPAPRVPERLSYVPPAGPAGQPQNTVLPVPAGEAWESVVAALRTQGLTLAVADERRGVVVATFSGDPAAWLDCGEIRATTVGAAATRTVPGAAERAEFRRGTQSAQRTVRRNQRLDARLVVLLEPDGEQTRIATSALYVLTRMLDAGTGVPSVETAEFRSGERGAFSGGVSCQSRGTLERAPLRGLTV